MLTALKPIFTTTRLQIKVFDAYQKIHIFE